jgi:hypothetical protein
MVESFPLFTAEDFYLTELRTPAASLAKSVLSQFDLRLWLIIFSVLTIQRISMPYSLISVIQVYQR